jgi:hypothetical protein
MAFVGNQNDTIKTSYVGIKLWLQALQRVALALKFNTGEFAAQYGKVNSAASLAEGILRSDYRFNIDQAKSSQALQVQALKVRLG